MCWVLNLKRLILGYVKGNRTGFHNSIFFFFFCTPFSAFEWALTFNPPHRFINNTTGQWVWFACRPPHHCTHEYELACVCYRGCLSHHALVRHSHRCIGLQARALLFLLQLDKHLLSLLIVHLFLFPAQESPSFHKYSIGSSYWANKGTSLAHASLILLEAPRNFWVFWDQLLVVKHLRLFTEQLCMRLYVAYNLTINWTI